MPGIQPLIPATGLPEHKRILDNLTSAVMLLDAQLAIRYMNPAAEMLLDASQRRLEQLNVKDWLSADEDELAVLKQTLETGHPYTKREAALRTQSGQLVTVDYSVNPVPYEGGIQLLLEIQARDRLLRIEREEELLARHATTRTLIRGMAHEVKNPLGGIRGAAQLLERELADPQLAEYTSIIVEEVDRLRNLVDRLLGPHQLPKQVEVNIHAILERVCSLISAEAGEWLTLKRDYDPSLPEFNGDDEQLIQAVLNIMRNAMQALQQASTTQPTLTLRTRALRQITLGSERHRLVCSVEIIDNGPGIDTQLLDSIFYPMVSGHAEGSGLGLSIAQAAINHHQGLIECRSEPGCTNFQLLIPLELHNDKA